MTRIEVHGCGNLEGAIGREDRTVVRQPLDPVGCPEVAKLLLHTLHHHVPDHLARDSSCRCHPADDLAVMAVRCERKRTTSPFQQVNSSTSEHQRMLERLVMMVPSCARRMRRPVCGASSKPFFFVSP
jgi:hypothetical protein